MGRAIPAVPAAGAALLFGLAVPDFESAFGRSQAKLTVLHHKFRSIGGYFLEVPPGKHPAKYQ